MKCNQVLGMTTICVTHDQYEALSMSDRIAVMNAGKSAQIGSPDELYESPANGFVADFIGESVILPLYVSGAHAMLRGQVLNLPSGCIATPDSLLVIRPERLKLLPDEIGRAHV